MFFIPATAPLDKPPPPEVSSPGDADASSGSETNIAFAFQFHKKQFLHMIDLKKTRTRRRLCFVKSLRNSNATPSAPWLLETLQMAVWFPATPNVTAFTGIVTGRSDTLINKLEPTTVPETG